MEVGKKRFRPIRVAMIEPVGGHGGMHYYDFGLCGGLVKAGCDVTLFTCDETAVPDNVAFAVRRVFRKIYGADPAWIRGIRYAIGSLRALFSCVNSGVKACHFHFFHVGYLEAFNIALAKMLLRKIVITAHDVESFVESLSVPRLARWVYRQADAVIAHNQVSKAELMDKLGVPNDKIWVIPHGNYLHMLKPLPEQKDARCKLGVPPGAKVLLFFGQIKDVKGLDLLLEAMPAILSEHPDALLLIAGKPWKSDFSFYERKMEELGIRGFCMAHIRYIPDEEVPFYYAAADLVVLPYRRIYQSGVLLMAMSYGKAVLTSDLPGMLEVVRNGVNGTVFRCGDSDELARKVIEAFWKGALQSLGGEGKDYVKKHHDWGSIGFQTTRLYHALVV